MSSLSSSLRDRQRSFRQMKQSLMSRMHASAIYCSFLSACRNPRELPAETARVKWCAFSVRSSCFSIAWLSAGSSISRRINRDFGICPKASTKVRSTVRP